MIQLCIIAALIVMGDSPMLIVVLIAGPLLLGGKIETTSATLAIRIERLIKRGM